MVKLKYLFRERDSGSGLPRCEKRDEYLFTGCLINSLAIIPDKDEDFAFGISFTSYFDEWVHCISHGIDGIEYEVYQHLLHEISVGCNGMVYVRCSHGDVSLPDVVSHQCRHTMYDLPGCGVFQGDLRYLMCWGVEVLKC